MMIHLEYKNHRYLRIIAATTIVILALSLLLPVSRAAEPDAVNQVVWHVDFGDPVRMGRTLTSVNNMLITYEGMLAEHDIRIVFLGAGIRFVTSDPLEKTPFAEDKVMQQERKVLMERLQSAMGQGIKLELCKITVNAIKLDADKIMKGVVLVPSGVVSIAEYQRKGYAYLKAD